MHESSIFKKRSRKLSRAERERRRLQQAKDLAAAAMAYEDAKLLQKETAALACC
jgi:hypothetical protein